MINDGELIIASTKFHSEFYLCDNEWHAVTAMVTPTDISIQVEGQDAVIVSKNKRQSAILAPLYLGGKSGIEILFTFFFAEKHIVDKYVLSAYMNVINKHCTVEP